MDIYSYLKSDHKKVSELFQQIIHSDSTAERQLLLDEVKTEILLHAASEQATFYKELRKFKNTKDEAKHGMEEHKEITQAMDKLDAIEINKDDWLIQFGELKSIVEHHVKEEETEMFKKAKKVLSSKRAKQLAVEMEEKKEELLEEVL